MHCCGLNVVFFWFVDSMLWVERDVGLLTQCCELNVVWVDTLQSAERGLGLLTQYCGLNVVWVCWPNSMGWTWCRLIHCYGLNVVWVDTLLCVERGLRTLDRWYTWVDRTKNRAIRCWVTWSWVDIFWVDTLMWVELTRTLGWYIGWKAHTLLTGYLVGWIFYIEDWTWFGLIKLSTYCSLGWHPLLSWQL